MKLMAAGEQKMKKIWTNPFHIVSLVLAIQSFGSDCKFSYLNDTNLEAGHFPICSELTWDHYPPLGGPHYTVWAAFKEYNQYLPPGFWMHNLEHGGLVFLYNCPTGCPEQVATLRQWIQMLPPENASCPNTIRRAILAPDSLLESDFAVIAWGHSMTSNCLDSLEYSKFMQDHFRKTIEDICSSGPDVVSENLCPEMMADIRNLANPPKKVRHFNQTFPSFLTHRLDGRKKIQSNSSKYDGTISTH